MLTALALLLMFGVAQTGGAHSLAYHELRAAVAAAEIGGATGALPAPRQPARRCGCGRQAAAPRTLPRNRLPMVGRPAARAPGSAH
jgi:hypothetical protein